MIDARSTTKLLLLTILLVVFIVGCSADNNDQLMAVSYTEKGTLYCLAASNSQFNIADIVDGGECGEDYARQGDLYDYMGSGSGFWVPPSETTCETQYAVRLTPGGPTFFFITHSLSDVGIEIHKAGESAIESRQLRENATCSVDFWVFSDPVEGDMLELRLGERTIPITIGDITARGGGGVSSLEPIGDQIRIGM